MVTSKNYSAVIVDALKDAGQKATLHQIPIRRAIKEGRKPGASEGVEVKPDTSMVTIGDREAQDAIIKVVRERLGDGVYIHAEEDGVVNKRTLEEATVRIVVDPIDGTGNYVRGLNSTLAEANVSDDHYPRTGWGSMMAIQECDAAGEWKTVAAGIYTPTKNDTPDDLRGKIYVAEDGVAGVTIVDLASKANEVVETPRTKDNPHANYLLSGYIDVKRAERVQLDALTAQRTDAKPKGPNAVAQAATALISGDGAVYVNERPNLHDQVAAVYLLEKAGFSVAVPPSFMRRDEAGDEKRVYPFLASDSAELTQELEAVVAGKKDFRAAVRESQVGVGSVRQ